MPGWPSALTVSHHLATRGSVQNRSKRPPPRLKRSSPRTKIGNRRDDSRRARRDSNPQPSVPKSQEEFARSETCARTCGGCRLAGCSERCSCCCRPLHRPAPPRTDATRNTGLRRAWGQRPIRQRHWGRGVVYPVR